MFMNTVRFGAARFVITAMIPPCSQTNKRLVSPGGNVMQTGRVANPGSPGNAATFVQVELDNPCPWAETTAPITKRNHNRKTPRIERQNLLPALFDVNAAHQGF